MAGTLDALSTSVDKRFEQINRRFDHVDEHFAEQRRYIEFAYERLDQRMTVGFDRLERSMLATNGHLERMERKLNELAGHSAAAPRRRKPKKQ